MFGKKQICAFVLTLAAVLGTVNTASAASTTNCTVTNLYSYNNRAIIYCNGNGYGHQIAGPGWSSTCPAVASDTIKIWENIAQSALLSGRKITIYYETGPSTCTSGGSTLSGQRVVTGIMLQSN